MTVEIKEDHGVVMLTKTNGGGPDCVFYVGEYLKLVEGVRGDPPPDNIPYYPYSMVVNLDKIINPHDYEVKFIPVSKKKVMKRLMKYATHLIAVKAVS